MDWMKSLQSAVDYIEDNLSEELTCDDVAEHVFLSGFHFQRVFSMLTGMTMGEYIRNRRLSQAGQELSMSDAKVIDVALKYGYESPESFTKAFVRFHGINPNRARKSGAQLKSFNRLTIKITMEGGKTMDYRIENREAFCVLAVTKKIPTETTKTDAPAFWDEFYSKGYDKFIDVRYGICHEMNSGDGQYSYSIAADCENDAEIPDGFEKLEIKAHIWAVFKCVGAMPKAIQNMWERIYNEWLPTADYQLLNDYSIEKYTTKDIFSPTYESEIWIPVRKK